MVVSDGVDRSKIGETPISSSKECAIQELDRSQRPVNRHFVEHKYHDHYNDPGPEPSSESDHVKHLSSSQRGAATLAFPEKLYSMLVASEEDGSEDVVAWRPHGRCFVIHKKDIFVNQIMPRFFHQTKLTSFQRQLNLYGFIRLTAGKDRGGYYHEYFIRGRPDLCRFMVRTRVKGNGLKAASSPETEPNFYEMEPCHSKRHGPKRREDKPVSTNNGLNPKYEGEKSCNPIKKHHESSGSSLIRKVSEDAGADFMTTEAISLRSAFARPWSDTRIQSDIVKPRVISPPVLVLVSSVKEENAVQSLEDSLSLSSVQQASAPCSGDVVFFEGLHFHYLDHMELDEVEDMLAESV